MSLLHPAAGIQPIEDPRDPRVADYVDARDPHLRLRRGIFIAESRPVVRRLLTASRFRVRSLLLSRAALDGLRDVLERTAGSLPVYLAAPDILQGILGFKFHRGCLAVGERGPEASPDALLGVADPRLVLVLEDLTDPDNVGAVFRNAMALGADSIFLSPAAADPLYRKAIRVSVGGTLSVPFARIAEWPAGLARLREAGYTLIALTPRPGALDITGLGTVEPLPRRLALLLGAEGPGLSDAARALADLEVRIPMAPGADSLNVATASGIALHCIRTRLVPARGDVAQEDGTPSPARKGP